MAARRSAAPLVLAAVLGIALIVAVRLVMGAFGGDGDSGGGSASGDAGGGATTAPAGCTEVSVVASSEKSALLTQLASSYNATGPKVAETCVWMTVSSKASGAAATALANGWDEARDGRRPDVWSPASSSWAVIVEQEAAAADQPSYIPAEQPSLAKTPLVIAMPKPMAVALGWPHKQIGWSDLATLAKSPKGWAAVGHPEWGRFKLGKTNPNYSTSGLNATIASYFAATGVSSDLTSKQVTDPKTQAFVKSLESSVVHYGDTTLTFLENMSREAAAGQGLTYVSAVTVEEKSVLDYNRGNPTGDPALAASSTAPAVTLAAIYPKDGTLISDNPWLVLDAPWVDATKKAAAADFLAWLQKPQAQSVFTDAGFRSFEGKPGAPLTQANGLIPAGATNTLRPPSAGVLADIKQSWDALRKRAHVLFIMDVSGSMGDPVPSAGVSKLKLAQDAAIESLNGFATNDEVGLWVFSTELGANLEPWLEMVPVGPGKVSIPKMKSSIAELVAGGGTALYATLRAAQKDMLADLSKDRINAIVLLSDGQNEYPQDTDIDSLLRQLKGERVDTSVRVFPIGYGQGADPEALTAIAEASRGHYYEANDPASIQKVLTSVLSNF
jgi:Ca-activated chloride channel family protein